MQRDNYLIEESLPDITPQNDRITIMRDRFQNISNNYRGMLYFCSRILNVPEKNINMFSLERFELDRFHKNEQFKENLSWPVSMYLNKIKELEQKIIDMGGEL